MSSFPKLLFADMENICNELRINYLLTVLIILFVFPFTS